MRQYLSLFARANVKRLKLSGAGDNRASHDRSLENNDALQQIASMGSDFVSVHQRTGEVDDCSFFSEQFHGLKPTDLHGAGFMERVHVADRPACLAALSRAFHENGKQRVELRLSCRSLDDSADHFRWIEMILSALKSDQNDESDNAGEGQILCVARDITRWKEREEELVDLQQVAQDSLEAKTRFLANMSHELRTPLNAIIGFSEMMKLPGIVAQNEQQIAEYAGIIHDSGRHLLGVVDEVHDMSQLAAGTYRLNPEIFSVADLVTASVETVQIVQFEADEKNVRIVVSGLDVGLQMSADFRACKQTLVALLAAFIKANTATGRVHLSISCEADCVGFTVSGAMPDSETERGSFRVGSQLRGLVDLLQASLGVGRSAQGQEEVALRLPSGLSTRSGISNIVSIDDRVDCVSEGLQKTA